MGALGGSITFLRFKVIQGDDAKQLFTRAINARRFQPLDPGAEVTESVGWVAIENPYDDESDIEREQYEYGDRIAIAFRQDQWAISRPRLRRETKMRVAKICADEGKPVEEVGRAFIKAIERAVMIEMRRRSTPRTKIVECVWSPLRGEMRAFGRGTVVVESVASLFERTFGVRLELAVPAVRAVGIVQDDERTTRALSRTSPSLLFQAR